MTISVVIPVLNEEPRIGALVKRLVETGGVSLQEVIVVDGGSTDSTCEVAKAAGACVMEAGVPGRAFQMNKAAAAASGDILYFVHADVNINPGYVADIREMLGRGYHAGCYRYKFDANSALLKLNAWMTRFPAIWCRGGDQTLFIARNVFDELGGYKSEMKIMEDYEFILRLRKRYRFGIIPKHIIVSARKYEINGYLRVQFANFFVFSMYFCGSSQDFLVRAYKKLLNYR